MAHRIWICGGNGAGKSTLGRALGELSGWRFADAEDYYFPCPGTYAVSRTKEEAAALLLADLERYEDFLFASVAADFGEAVMARFTHAVLVSAPKGLRMRRIRERSYQKFGDRMRPGGDLHQQEEAFFRMAERRPEGWPESWLAAAALPAIQVDGARPPSENAAYILETLGKGPKGLCTK